MLSAIWHLTENPVFFALPFFGLFIAVEMAALLLDRHKNVRGYVRKDTAASLSMGLGSLPFQAVFKLATLPVYVLLWTYVSAWHLPVSAWWYWPLLMLVIDFAWYWQHRFGHRVRIAWAAHQAHHSSEYFNLGTALRQKWNPWAEAMFWIPLPMLGFAPWTMYIAFAFNLIYQFFTHTETVGKLWAPIEFVLNTPSHHRVHHGSDPQYLDKNYGGILIVWDRLFGTFCRESDTPVYGLTKPVSSYNPVRLEYYEYANIVRDVRSADGLRNKLGYIFAPPGWMPKHVRRSLHDDAVVVR
jgi:sterol desaturase/sphingolipid hydroxylase (fatty acid hydroxylase superfamily)